VEKVIRVLLARQLLQAYAAGKKVFEFDCATGDSGHPTGVGVFSVLRKHEVYRSKKYDVQMDYAMFFTADGKAIHKSHFVGPVSVLKYMGVDCFGSHGCVRLSGDDAMALFAWTPLGTRVEVLSS
jgi:lipoprotein-anchoring transpeptidase ErfK/SrfK